MLSIKIRFKIFQDLYRNLLEAESEGILDDVDMAEVEKFILDPKSAKRPHDAHEKEESKIRTIDTESEGILHDINTEEAEKLIPDLEGETKSVKRTHDADEEEGNKRRKKDSS